MNCEPHNDLHTEECIKGIAPCDGFRCSICGTMLTGDMQGNPNPCMCHECADSYVGAAHREMDTVRSSVNYSEPETIDITPVGCQTPEGNARVNAAMKAFEEAREEVARLATMLHKDGCFDDSSVFDELRAAIEERFEAENAFLRAVAGR
jgi:hypothetical protein